MLLPLFKSKIDGDRLRVLFGSDGTASAVTFDSTSDIMPRSISLQFRLLRKYEPPSEFEVALDELVQVDHPMLSAYVDA